CRGVVGPVPRPLSMNALAKKLSRDLPRFDRETPHTLTAMGGTGPDIEALVEAKARARTSISVCLPARNEEATVGQIVATVRRHLVDHAPLVDEVVVVDDGSTDATAEAASWEGARVVAVD